MGDVALTSTDLAERMQQLKGQGAQLRAADALELLIDETLLAAQSESEGLAKEPATAAGIEAARRRLAATAFVEQELGKLSKVTGEQVVEAFHLNTDRVRLDWIVLATKAEAQALLARLAGGSKFEAEARASLDASTSGQGGALGWKVKRELEPEIATAAFASPLGQIVGPLERKLGWALIRVQERTLGTEAELAAARQGLTRFVTEQLRTMSRHHMAEQLRARFKLQLDEAFVKSLGSRLLPQGDEAAHVVARAGGRTITYGEVASAMAKLVGTQDGHLTGPAVKLEYTRNLADQMLLEIAAIEAGKGESEPVVSELRRARRSELALAQVRKAFAKAAVPTPAEMEAYHRAHWAASPQAQGRPCAHILLDSRQGAEAVAKTIAAGRPFAEVAKVKSIDLDTGPKGGSLGILTPSRLDSLEPSEPGLTRALREARPDQVAGPVQSGAGWHLILCGSPESTPPPLTDADRAALKDILRKERADEAVRALLVQLRSSRKIVTDTAALGRFAVSVEN